MANMDGLAEALGGAIDKMKRDAARYRWLRDVGDATWRPFALREGYSAEMADKAIDEAMLKTPNALANAPARTGD